MAEKRILLSVGDDSGDMHAANLMRALREIVPGVRFAGYGLGRMAAEGLEPLDPGGQEDSEMWLRNLLRIGRFRRRLGRFRDYLRAPGADLVIPVDYGGFNLYLCRAAGKLGVPVLYYIPPQVWAHGRYRLRKLRRWVRRAALVYPFEAGLYRDHGVDAEYVGHPLFDELDRHPPSESVTAGLRRRLGPDLIGIFAGSRAHELRAHLPVVAAACRGIRERMPEAAFAMVSTEATRPLAAELLAACRAEIELLEDVRPAELAEAAALCITKSGTITLEIASRGTPMVVFYRIGPVGRFLFDGLSGTPYIGLVNSLAGRMICPERLMSRPEPGWVVREALRLLSEPAAAQSCRAAIAAALEGFAAPGASEQAAKMAAGLLRGEG